MKLKKCEYCGTEFDAALSQCPLCGKAVQPGAAEPQPVMPAAYKPAGGRGGKFSKKKGGHFAADPKKEKEAKSAENPYKIPKWMMVTICVILGLAVLMGAAFALYQLSWFPKFLSPKEPVSMQEPAQQPAQEAASEPAQPAAPTEQQYMNEEDYQPEEADEQPEEVVPCEGLTLATSSITFDEPERFYNITVQKLPETCNQEVTFTSSDETIATVNQQGKVVAVNGGTAVITAVCGDQTATCLVTCDFIAEEEQEQPEELPPALNSTDMTLFYPGEQAPLIVSNIPEGAQVTFTSENASVATVTSSGTITAVGSGTTTVRAEVSGTKLECIVRCKLDSSAESGADVDAEGCTLSHSDVTMAFLGEYFKISLKDADGNRVKGLSWKSGNTGVCTVDADGVVTATGKGTTTVSTTYGGKSFECIIRCNLK